MFYLHLSNKTESLVKTLIETRARSTKSHLFEKDIFIIQDEGVERWLTQQIAFKQGLFTNYEFLSLPIFIAKTTSIIGVQSLESQIERSTLIWFIHSILKQKDFSGFKILDHYFKDDNLGLYRFQLAQQLSKIFDRYQRTSPEILKAWENDQILFPNSAFSETELGQKYIWNEVLGLSGGGANSYFDSGQQVMDKIKYLSTSDINKLPKSISVFALQASSELDLQFLNVISQYIDVHFYLLSPTENYWLNLKEINNPILKNFGEQGKCLNELISLENTCIDTNFNTFGIVGRSSLLNMIQNDVVHNKTPSENKNIIPDGSLKIHNCHTVVRELEVLKNEILEVMNTEEITFRDVIVLAPNIEKYVPYITAIFSDVKHQISDESLRDSNVLISIFEKFLSVATSRFGWQEVLDLLSTPEVYASFGLSEFDLQPINHWVKNTNIRWAYSAEQKVKLDLPADEVNTWQAAIEQMFYGYAVGNEHEFVDNIFPYPEIEGSTVIILGALYDYLNLLFSANKDFASTHTLHGWSKVFKYYSKVLFNNDLINSKQKMELISLVNQLEESNLDFYALKVGFPVINNWFQSQSTTVSSTYGFLSGGLTFCSMKPKCVLPFKVIALLGMNEGDFPKRETQTTLDLTQVVPKIRDSSKLLEGKNQFLETLLSAREKLLIFYQGQSAENNAALQPSSVVSDLIDVVTEYYGLQEEMFVIKHALQAYHNKYFDSIEQKDGGCHDFYSYNDFHLSIAQKQLENHLNGKSGKALSPWWPIDGEIETDLPTVIEMRDLIAFVKNPQAYFVKQVLHINLNSADSLLEETESFVFTNLEKYLVKDDLVSCLSNRSTENADVRAKIYQEFKVKGRLLGGEIGRLDFQDKYANALKYQQKFLEIEGVIGLKCEDIIFDFKLENSHQYQLTGVLSNQYEHAMVLYRFGDLKGKTLTETWIKHLLLNQVIAKTTYLIYGQDEIRILKFSFKDQLLSPLVKWINLFVAGQLKPSDFMSEPGLAYVCNSNSARSTKSPVEKAFDSFQKQLSSEFEPEINLLYKQLGEKDKGLLFGDKFQLVCDDLLKPVVEVLGL